MWSQASLFYIVMTLALGCGAGVLAFLALFWEHRTRLKKFAQWEHNIEHLAIQAIRDDARAVESKLALMTAVGTIPADFNPTAFLTCRIGEGLQRAVVYEAEQQGIVPAGTFERVFQQPILPANAAPDPRPPPPPSWDDEYGSRGLVESPTAVTATDAHEPISEPRLKVVGSMVRRATG